MTTSLPPSLRSLFRSITLAALFTLALPPSAGAQGARLARAEQRMRDWIREQQREQVEYLARVVNIPSGTMNFQGVKRTGQVFQATLDSLGFETRWIPMDSVNRAGHLFAEHRGRSGTKTLLLIGHLDTVFEGEGERWEHQSGDSVARGAGSSDMKGGDVVMVYALKALQAAAALKDANIIVALIGDEELVGKPVSIARHDLIDAARRSHVALAFESGEPGSAVIARRGSSSWRLDVTGRQAHSSGIFGENTGYGAVFEATRIVDEFRERLSRVPNLTFNPAIVAGGAEVAYDSVQHRVTAASKTNIIAPRAVVVGDLRFLRDEQRDSARSVMREIVGRSLPGTSAQITFIDSYPAMPPTASNRELLGVYSQVSQALGYGAVEPFDPGRRGAGDISFVADDIPAALDGLGADGGGAHSPDERVDLRSLAQQTERAAVLLYRLSREKAPPRTREAIP
ncbi:MAG TPA: M20/M25/M40 family metallo-hydrolase [Gemmatimonadaceae bacterium]|nr:M20/M25/M40 family metallo-hydrolase [Gemmatimonadaceae bacterium]